MRRLTTLLALGLGIAAPTTAQDDPLPLKVEARFEPAKAAPGSEVTLEVILDVDPGWHVYGTKEKTSLPVSVKLTSTGELRAQGEPEIPPGTPKSAHGNTSFELTGKVVLKQKMKVPAALGAGAQTVKGKVSFMVCDEQHCLPPGEEEFTATLTVTAKGDEAQAGKAKADSGNAPPVKIEARFEPAKAAPGSDVTLEVILQVEPGWHVYGTKEKTSLPVSVKLTSTGELRTQGEPEIPPGTAKAAHGNTSFELTGKVVLKQKLKVPTALGAGAQTVKGKVSFMVCDEQHCLPPSEEEFTATLTVAKGDEGKADKAKTDEGDPAPVQIEARFEPAKAAPGSDVTLEVILQVEPGWHVYGTKETVGQPVSVKVTSTGELRAQGEPKIPTGDPTSAHGATSYELTGKVVVTQVLKVPAQLGDGPQVVKGKVAFMVCDEHHCLPPSEEEFTATLTVGKGAPAGKDAPKKGLPEVKPGYVKAEARIEPASPTPGSEATLIVRLTVEPGIHIYGSADPSPTTVTLLETGALRAVGEPVLPPGEAHGDNSWLLGTIEVQQKLRVPADVKGPQTVRARVSYLPCNESVCFEQGSIEAEAIAEVPGGSGASTNAPKAVAFTVRTEPSDPRPGEAVDVVVSVQLAKGVAVGGRADSKATTLTSKKNGWLAVGTNRLPEGSKQKERHLIEGGFELRQALRVPEGEQAGSMELPFDLTYQLQDADGTLVRTETLAAKVEVTQGEPRSQYLGAAVRVAEFGGLLGLLLAAIGAGLLALLMPCTYPMIPITISFFTKQASTRGGSVTPLAMAYGFGIVLIFILIGLFAAPVIVPFATHWITNTVITAAFLFFAASLFGLVTLQPPKFLLNLAGAATQKGGYLGVFLMGATLVITSFTCTVPVAGALLSLTADGGGWYVIAGMAVFGLTMAVPFVLLSLLPGRLRSVPRAGAWMDTLKVFLGFVELAAAMKFASNVDIALHEDPHWLKREPFLWIWVALFAGAGVYLLLPLLRGQVRLGVGRSIGILFSLLFAGYCGYGALGHPFPKGDPVMAALAPPATEEPSRHEIVRDNYDKALKSAKEQGKLVLVNFTGFT